MTRIRSFFYIIIGFFLIYSLSKTVLDYRKKLQFYEEYKQEYNKKKGENSALKSAIIKNQDADALEREIRNRLNRSRPGEYVVVMPATSPQPTPRPTEYKSIPHQWIEIFVKGLSVSK